MRIIDFHTHLADRWLGTPLPGENAFLTALDRCGVEAACIFTLMGFYEDCTRCNNELAAYARRHPTRLIPFVTVDPKLGKAAVAELERCLADPIFRGVKFHPWLQAFACSMVRTTMTDILKLAATRQMPVIFHDGTPPYSTTFQIANLARWVPEATVVLGHGGLGDYVQPAGQLLRDLPNLYACTACPKAGDIRHLVDMAGPHKVLFGSDLIADWRTLAERLDDLYEADLAPDVMRQVTALNAARLLKLDGPSE